ncbi:cell cycle checkpoint [Fomitiporia mediterranea MF3/22]|uniref:cell cycle checkpoint n=1 Tax=Fomitiporia mediterranea (strain MF3/22) TaxID=694068 RepID=UPI0004408D3A|nr:cell cycle checkpoint [Fomitiporia mediterranea MF3/22]EJD06814.1 cell cycle checkpoint [Fomitiporia mediterranea MF3/22]
MRFRANIDHVQTFQRIIQAIEKLQKRCIVRFTESEMHIICNEETEDGVQDSLFTDYRIQSNANNEISLLLSPEALLQALRSAASSSDVVMKLAKKHAHPVLSFEIVLALRGTRRASVAHDVLIDVLKPAEMARLKEPLCPEPDIHILLPPLQKLRTVVERMRSMADVLGIYANHKGGLRLTVESDQVRVKTEWSKCIIPNMDSERSRDEPEPDPDQWFGVHLSIRAFLKFLSSHVVSTTTIACICEDHCMILYVYIGDVQDAGGVLTFWIPARLSGVD